MKLQLDADHVVDDGVIADLLDIPAGHIRGIYLMHCMVFEDGGLVARAHLYFDRDLTDGRSRENIQIEIAGDGLHCYNLSRHAAPDREGSSAMEEWGSVRMGDEVLYVQGTRHALLASRGGKPVIQEVAIEHAIGNVRINADVAASLRPSRSAHPVSEGDSVAMPLSDGSSAKHFAILMLSRDRLQASWSPFLSEGGGAEPAHSWVSRLLRKPPAPEATDQLLRLDADDFPRMRSPHVFTPLINEALIRDGRLYVYTKGHTDSPKYGYDCSDIAEIGMNGRVVSRLFAQDYTNTGDEKKYGINGRFTSSGRYCVLSPVYQSTDPWKGRQALFDMDSRELVEVAMPRGYARFRIVDHAGDGFWAELPVEGQSPSQRLARFRAM